MNEKLTGQVIDIFKSKIGWTVYYNDEINDGNQNNCDGQLQVITSNGVIHLSCEIKKSVVPSSIAAIKQNIEDNVAKDHTVQASILLANYISTKARRMLVENNINFADTGGNIFLKNDNIHIQIETGQSDRSALSKEGGRAFTKAGLRVLYQFFRSEDQRDINGNLVNTTNQSSIVNFNSIYEEISKEAKVSKDTVSKVIHDLLDQGYILRKSKIKYAWRDK